MWKTKRRNNRKTFARVAVVNPIIESALDAAIEAAEKGFIKPLLIGNKGKIEELIKSIGHSFEYEMIDVDGELEAGKKAVELVNSGKADIILKGSISTSNFLRPILHKESGLVKKGALVSHISVFGIDKYHKLLIVSDVAVNITPDLNEKVKITKNAIELAHNLDIEKPKVAILAAAESVNEKMPSSLDAAIIAKMGDRGVFGNAIVEGPMALDLAVSEDACNEKNFVSPVGGDADVVIAPNIDAGNVLYKTLTKLTNSELAAILSGTKAPVVLTSRGDTAEIKYSSLLLALMMLRK